MLHCAGQQGLRQEKGYQTVSNGTPAVTYSQLWVQAIQFHHWQHQSVSNAAGQTWTCLSTSRCLDKMSWEADAVVTFKKWGIMAGSQQLSNGISDSCCGYYSWILWNLSVCESHTWSQYGPSGLLKTFVTFKAFQHRKEFELISLNGTISADKSVAKQPGMLPQ